MKGWQRIAIVLSIVEFVGVGALLWIQFIGGNTWIQFIGGNTDFFSDQLRACVTQLEKADQSAPEPPGGAQKDRLQTENFEKYLTCQAQARTSLNTLTESQKQTMWMIAAIDAAMLAAGWLLAFGVVALARLVIRRLGGFAPGTFVESVVKVARSQRRKFNWNELALFRLFSKLWRAWTKDKMTKEFERPDALAQKEFKEQLSRDAPIAMADYKRAYDAKMDRMFELRRIRLAKQKPKQVGNQDDLTGLF